MNYPYIGGNKEQNNITNQESNSRTKSVRVLQTLNFCIEIGLLTISTTNIMKIFPRCPWRAWGRGGSHHTLPTHTISQLLQVCHFRSFQLWQNIFFLGGRWILVHSPTRFLMFINNFNIRRWIPFQVGVIFCIWFSREIIDIGEASRPITWDGGEMLCQDGEEQLQARVLRIWSGKYLKIHGNEPTWQIEHTSG